MVLSLRLGGAEVDTSGAEAREYSVHQLLQQPEVQEMTRQAAPVAFREQNPHGTCLAVVETPAR